MSNSQSAFDHLSGQSVLVVVAHGDDAVLFLGGTIRLLANAGAHVHVLRFTDDATDSDGLSATETICRNENEFALSAGILGVQGVTSLGFASDSLGDQPRGVIREAGIRAIRRLRPYAVFSFDPYAVFGEDNQDHIRLAQEMDESFWTAMFDKHHPEHFLEGLSPHGIVERWYFGRSVVSPTIDIDVSTVIDAKVNATLAHTTMMGNFMAQLRLMGQTAGIEMNVLRDRFNNQDAIVSEFVNERITESFRVVRFSGAEQLFVDLEKASK
jgi:LmbE family N-acetylglucosaminyl deacetylase